MKYKHYDDDGIIIYNGVEYDGGTVYFKKEDFAFALEDNMFYSRSLCSVLSFSSFLKKDCFISDHFIVVMPGEML